MSNRDKLMIKYLAILLCIAVLFSCKNKTVNGRDYQLEYHLDTLWIYDGERLVGTHINTDTSAYIHGTFIDTTIMNDNQ